jgi:hypothetical protein
MPACYVWARVSTAGKAAFNVATLGFVERERQRPLLNRPGLATDPARSGEAIWHQMGGETGNVKFLSADRHHESVVDAEGNEVTGTNAATYNFGTNPLSHLVLDVIPFIFVGSHSPGDDSGILDRLAPLLFAPLPPDPAMMWKVGGTQ